jgi:hypothetical protein
LEAQIEKGGCVEMRVGKCIKYLKVEEIGAIDIYDANATIMNRVTFIFSVIYKYIHVYITTYNVYIYSLKCKRYCSVKS